MYRRNKGCADKKGRDIYTHLLIFVSRIKLIEQDQKTEIDNECVGKKNKCMDNTTQKRNNSQGFDQL